MYPAAVVEVSHPEKTGRRPGGSPDDWNHSGSLFWPRERKHSEQVGIQTLLRPQHAVDLKHWLAAACRSSAASCCWGLDWVGLGSGTGLLQGDGYKENLLLRGGGPRKLAEAEADE